MKLRRKLSIKKLAIVLLLGLFTGCSVDGKEVLLNVEATEQALESDSQLSEPAQATAEPTETPTAQTTPESTPEPTPKPQIDYSAIKPNEIGKIMIIMYHSLTKDDPTNPYQRTIDGFKSDLQNLYDQGFRTIPMADLINNNIKVEAGFSPVIITFDDGYHSAFSLVNENENLVPASDCAVDIMNKFYEEHPDFGKNAVFYINGKPEAFKGAGTLAQRFEYLIDNGYEIGNHTYSHLRLRNLEASELQEEIGKVHNLVKDKIGYSINSIAYPFGETPQKELIEFGLNGVYEDTNYEYGLALRVGQTGDAVAPNHIKFNPYSLPRVQGTDRENTDLGWFLRMYKQSSEGRYISDGDPDVISVPEKYRENINMDSLEDKQLHIY